MKAKEFVLKKRDPNWKTMQDIRKSGAGGSHRDKKKEQKQGYEKHKGQNVTEISIHDKLYNRHQALRKKSGLPNPDYYKELKASYDIEDDQERLAQQAELKKKYKVAEGSDTEKQILTRIRQIMYDRKLSGTDSNAGELLRLKQKLKDIRNNQGVTEVTGDKSFDQMMKGIVKGTAKQKTADRKERKEKSKQQAKDAFAGMFGGGNPADKLSIRKPTEEDIDNDIVIKLDGEKVPGNINDFDHARNKASKLISYRKGEIAEIYVDGKLKMRLKLNTPHQHFEQDSTSDEFEYVPKNPASFNDDDFYAYDPTTKIIKSSWSHKSVGRMHSEYLAQKEGWQVVSGLRGKSLGLLIKKPSQVKEFTDIPFNQCPYCSGPIFHESLIMEKRDACYHKVRSRYKVWPSAYASGALVQCRKKGAKNWGNKSKQ